MGMFGVPSVDVLKDWCWFLNWTVNWGGCPPLVFIVHKGHTHNVQDLAKHHVTNCYQRCRDDRLSRISVPNPYPVEVVCVACRQGRYLWLWRWLLRMWTSWSWNGESVHYESPGWVSSKETSDNVKTKRSHKFARHRSWVLCEVAHCRRETCDEVAYTAYMQ